MPFYLLLFLFIVIPVTEIAVLIQVGGVIGVGSTILVVILTAFLGAYLVRQQGLKTITELQDKMQQGQIPALQMAEGVALLFAGAVLLTPGFITDAFGFALLTPAIRRRLINWLLSKGFVQAQPGYQSSQYSQTVIIDGEFRDQD